MLGHVAVENQEDVVGRSNPVREVEAERPEAHDVRVERAHGIFVARIAIEDRLEHAVHPWSFSGHLRMMLDVRRVPRPDRKELRHGKGIG
jgi:hypothetical protein